MQQKSFKWQKHLFGRVLLRRLPNAQPKLSICWISAVSLLIPNPPASFQRHFPPSKQYLGKSDSNSDRQGT